MIKKSKNKKQKNKTKQKQKQNKKNEKRHGGINIHISKMFGSFTVLHIYNYEIPSIWSTYSYCHLGTFSLFCGNNGLSYV